MVQLNILTGSQAGGVQAVRRFPFHVGRASDNDLCFDAPGVWNYHFVIDLRRHEGIAFHTFDDAYAAVNDHPLTSAILRNGDVISFGSAKVQFWLAPPSLRGLGIREIFMWLLLILITAGQITVISWLWDLH